MKAIELLKSGLGYTWAALCLIIVLATFIGLNFWSKILANETGIQVSPLFTGGEVRLSADHGQYRTLTRRPVFDGLLGERSDGFVQIDWVPKENRRFLRLCRRRKTEFLPARHRQGSALDIRSC